MNIALSNLRNFFYYLLIRKIIFFFFFSFFYLSYSSKSKNWKKNDVEAKVKTGKIAEIPAKLT
jgi:hypothetical protein